MRVMYELGLRSFLFITYYVCQILPPFQRVIQPEELWLYKYPHSESYIPMFYLWFLVTIIPLLTIFIQYHKVRCREDLTEALWCFSLIIALNGAVSNVIKLLVGRPRPDYADRCFPQSEFKFGRECSGVPHIVMDGRKSFPSAHSSVAFAAFGFMAFFMAGKMKVFAMEGKGNGSNFLAPFCPLFFAMCVAISRTCDYHHHWQDVLVGSVLGLFIAALCYFQYYPRLGHDDCDIPWKLLHRKTDTIVRIKEI